MFKLVVLLLFAFSALSCSVAQNTGAVTEPSIAASAVKDTGLAEQTDEWNRTLNKARKEGRIFLYSTYPPQLRVAVMEGFYKRTGINVEIVTGVGAEISAKLMAERRAGLYVADAYVGGTTTLLIDMKPKGALVVMEPVLFLPEVLDTKLWYKNALPWLDKEKTVMQTRYMAGGSQADVVYNTNLSSKSEFVSWYDLLNPKFKGKINLQDPTAAGKGGKFVNQALTHYGLNWDYMRALAKQEPFVTRDKRLMLDWVAQGKHIASINPDSVTFEEYRKTGAPMEVSILKETRDVLGGGYSGVALIDKAPHPYAAKLFVNWFLSKEGQIVYARADGSQSAREDVPVDHLPPNKVRQPGMDYAVETEEFILQEAKFRPMIIEIFGHLIAK